MGAWGLSNFENDSALEWVDEFLEEEDKKGFLKDTFAEAKGRGSFLGKFFRRDTDLEEPEASAVLVAGEVVSLIKGNPSTKLPEDVRNWVNSSQLELDKTIIKDALSAIQNVKVNSELMQLWEETDEYHDWLQEVEDLQNRLRMYK
ncbi:DUF4259 domain-containing protein [Alkalihalobacillus macyae]|uniref:DUF4259 domain-containing protein n=1 Tax=Guptibacillus hwajinpoensis TaxID=208199 RepID=UPI00273B6F4F|nr:DUF4259 domain-containing protein [Alkalihalobacillus macyae]MDP4551906.1 DUF4259 domain-containing protein [Alkalihalobacillus macyae]